MYARQFVKRLVFSEKASAPCRPYGVPERSPQTPKIADCSRVSVMALATSCALKRPGRHYLSIVGEWCGKRLAANHGGLAEMMLRARSAERKHSQASHDMFHLTWHIAQRSWLRTESGVSWSLRMLPTMLGQGHGPHDGTRTGC